MAKAKQTAPVSHELMRALATINAMPLRMNACSITDTNLQYTLSHATLVSELARAILAEREHCAKIAESLRLVRSNTTFDLGFDEACRLIDAAIRRGPENGEATARKTQPEANE